LALPVASDWHSGDTIMSTPVDARGLSCPQPVMLTKQALEGATGAKIVVLVDTMTQVQNCTRMAETCGWQVSYEEREGAFTLTMRK